MATGVVPKVVVTIGTASINVTAQKVIGNFGEVPDIGISLGAAQNVVIVPVQ